MHKTLINTNHSALFFTRDSRMLRSSYHGLGVCLSVRHTELRRNGWR